MQTSQCEARDRSAAPRHAPRCLSGARFIARLTMLDQTIIYLILIKSKTSAIYKAIPHYQPDVNRNLYDVCDVQNLPHMYLNKQIFLLIN